jgi:hypothetical protein
MGYFDKVGSNPIDPSAKAIGFGKPVTNVLSSNKLILERCRIQVLPVNELFLKSIVPSRQELSNIAGGVDKGYFIRELPSRKRLRGSIPLRAERPGGEVVNAADRIPYRLFPR